MSGYKNKKIVVFDLDETLAESKCEMDSEMSELLNSLLDVKKVAVISGGSYTQFQKQFLASLTASSSKLKNLYLLPTCGTSMYVHKGDWSNVYEERLHEEEKEKIFKYFWLALEETGNDKPEKQFGDIIEDRITQVTFSALGQQAPINLKASWDPDCEKRNTIIKKLEIHLPEFEIRTGGTTSIDVTKKGIDKAYGIRQIEKHVNLSKNDMLFIGDKLFEGGNDYPVKRCGVECIESKGPTHTKEIIREILFS